MPTTANPPKPITAPSGISRTASAKLGKILLFTMPAGSAQVAARGLAGEKFVGPQKKRQHQRPVRRPRQMAVALRPPDVVTGAHLALVVDEAAFEDEGLLDLD